MNTKELIDILIKKEKQYGGHVTHIKRNKFSELDPRKPEEINKIGMTGGDRMEFHGYSNKYAEYLLPVLKKRNVVIAEIGILKGTGLAIWCDLFENSRVIGMDIDVTNIQGNMRNLKKLGAFKKNDPEIYEFDQLKDNNKYLKKILNNDKISVCVDDAMHTDKSILNTLDSVMPHMAKDFVYFVEDNASIGSEIRKKYPQYHIEISGELTIISSGKFKKSLRNRLKDRYNKF